MLSTKSFFSSDILFALKASALQSCAGYPVTESLL